VVPDPSSMVPGPRNMNQGGRARFENGEIVQPSASMMVDTTTSDTVAKGLAKKLLNYQQASKGVDNQTKQYLMNLFQKDLENTGYTVEEVMRYMPQNMSEGGQLVQPNADGSRPGYSGLPTGITKVDGGYKIRKARFNGPALNTTKKTLAEAKAVATQFDKDYPIKKSGAKTQYTNVLNKYSNNIHNKPYNELSDKQQKEVYKTAQNAKFVYRDKDYRSLPENKKNKLIAHAKKKNIKLDFNKYPKYGVSPYTPQYSTIQLFVGRNFKEPNLGKNLLKEKDRIKVMDNFELPEGVKNWDFDSNRYGIPYKNNERLYARISANLKDKKKYSIAADPNSPKGWMMASMERLYKNELKNKVKPENLTYKPIKKNGIIIGFTDTTAAGGNKTYYGLNKNTPENAPAWTAHGDYDRVKKFLNIAKGVKAEPDAILQKILDEKGISKLLKGKRSITLNDVLSHERYYDTLSKTQPIELIKRQVVLHHKKGVGGNVANAAATKDLQLLNGLVNKKITTFENTAKKRKLNIDEIAQLKNYGAKITDFDGKVVGGGYTDPTKQFAAIEKEALKYAKGDQFNVKTVASYLERLGCGKAAGGRILFAEGVPSLTKCAKEGVKKLEKGLKNGFKNADDAVLARGILKSGKFLKDAVSLRGLFGPAALGFTALAEAGFVSYDMLSSGKSFREAVGDSIFNYVVKGTDHEIDSEEEFIKRLKNIKTGPSGLRDFSDEEIGKMQYFKENLKDMGTGFDLFNQLKEIEDRQETERGGTQSDLFSENAFQLDAAKDKIQADIQDYNRTGTPKRVTDYLLSPKATAGADAAKKAALLVKQDQLQDAGTGKWYQAGRGDDRRRREAIDTKFQLEQMSNPTTPDPFREYFMGLPKGEQSKIMSYGYSEGGITGLRSKYEYKK